MGYRIVRMKGKTINHSNKEAKLERKTNKKYIPTPDKTYDVIGNVNNHKAPCIWVRREPARFESWSKYPSLEKIVKEFRLKLNA